MISDDVTQAFGRAARAIYDEPTTEKALQVIVDSTRGAVRAADHVSVCVRRGGRGIERPATTSPLARDLDALQCRQQDGPLWRALDGGERILAPHVGSDERWPAYAHRAAELGLRSQLTLPLLLEGEGTVGGLNLYSTSSDTIDPGDVVLAGLFATQATAALGAARRVETLTEAIGARQRIGQALGILMERYRLSANAAQAFLWRRSMNSNVKVRDLAEDLVADAEAKAARSSQTPEASRPAPADELQG